MLFILLLQKEKSIKPFVIGHKLSPLATFGNDQGTKNKGETLSIVELRLSIRFTTMVSKISVIDCIRNELSESICPEDEHAGLTRYYSEFDFALIGTNFEWEIDAGNAHAWGYFCSMKILSIGRPWRVIALFCMRKRGTEIVAWHGFKCAVKLFFEKVGRNSHQIFRHGSTKLKRSR